MKCGASVAPIAPAQPQQAAQEQVAKPQVQQTAQEQATQEQVQQTAQEQAPQVQQTAQEQAPQVQQTAQEQVAQPQVQQTAQEQATQPQYNTQQAQPQYGAQQPVYTTSSQMKKKRKKWPIVLAVVLCVVVALGAVAFSMRESIKMLIMPEEQAKAALRASSATLKESVLKAVDSDSQSFTQYQDKAKLSYTFGIDKATVAGSDYLSYVKAKAVRFEVEYSVTDKVIDGTIGVLNDSRASSSVLELQFYMDRNNTYMRVPALFSESLSMSTSQIFSGSDVSFDELFTMLSSGKSSTLQQYTGLVEPVVNDVMKSVDSLIDIMEYRKVGKVDITGSQGTIGTTQFEVTVTGENIREFLNNVVDNIYADESLKALLALASGSVTKDGIKKEIENLQVDFESMQFYLYVTNKAEVARITVSTDNIGDYQGDRAELDLQFVGKSSIYDEVKVSLSTNEAAFDIDLSVQGDAAELSLDVKEKNSTSKNGNGSIHIYMNATKNGQNSVTMNTCEVSGTVDGTSFEVAMSGSVTLDSITGVSRSKSDFTNAIDVSKITNSQSTQLMSEIVMNMSVFKNILSDDVYNKMYKSMFGSTMYGFY
jgi:hypothetical protein